MMPLFEGAAILVLVVMFGVSVATSLLIERQRLFALADSAALVGSESFDPTLLRQGADGIVVTLDSARVRAAEGNFLDRSCRVFLASGLFYWGRLRESNPRPSHYE